MKYTVHVHTEKGDESFEVEDDNRKEHLPQGKEHIAELTALILEVKEEHETKL